MKRRLTLSSERLSTLTEDELRFAAGAAEESLTYQIECALTIRYCYTNGLCSKLCFHTT